MMDDRLDRSGRQRRDQIPEIVRYREILSKDPRSLVFASLAEIYRKHGMFEQAIQVCIKGMKFHPDYVGGRVALGRAYFDLGEMEKAREEMEHVLGKHPDNLIALRTMAEIDTREGRIHEALMSYGRILRVHPHNDETTRRIGQLRTRLNREREEQKINGHVKSGIATKTMAAIYLQQGFVEDAREIFHKVLEQVPDDDEARKMLDELGPASGKDRKGGDIICEGGAR